MRACSGRGGGTVRARSVRMRCTGAWAARGTCRVGAGALGCAVIRAKGGGEQGRAHMVRNARLETRRPRRPVYSSRLVPFRRSQRERTRRANYRPVHPRESPILVKMNIRVRNLEMQPHPAVEGPRVRRAPREPRSAAQEYPLRARTDKRVLHFVP